MRSTSTSTRRGPRLLLRAALPVVLLSLSLVVSATPAQADHTIDCTPMADQACKDLTPVVECYWLDGSTYSTAWGYTNPSSHTLRIDFGAKNKLSPGPDDQGQGTLFTPGVHHNVFVSTGSGTLPTWTLGNSKASPSQSTTAACTTKPVSVIGSVRALLIGIVLLLAVSLPVLAARRGRRGVPA